MSDIKSKQLRKESRIYYFGKWIVTPFFAIGSGVISAVATSGLSFVATLTLPWLGLLVTSVFLAETAVWIFLFRKSVPETLVNVFARNIFSGLSTTKKYLLGFGLFCALSSGFTLGGLTFVSSNAAVGAIFGMFSLSVPFLTILFSSSLAFFGFIAITGLFSHWIASVIKNDIHKQVAQYFRDIFIRDSRKHIAQQILEGFFKLFFVSIMLGLIVIGTIATLGTLQKGLNAFLGLIPHANLVATKIASCIIAYGLMGMARLPLVIQSVCTVFSHLGEYVGYSIFRAGSYLARHLGYNILPSIKPIIHNVNAQETLLSATAKTGALLMHGFSFGALAQSGGGAVLSDAMNDLHFPLSVDQMDTVGQASAMISGGVMSIGVAAHSFFYKQPEQVTTAVSQNGAVLSQRSP